MGVKFLTVILLTAIFSTSCGPGTAKPDQENQGLEIKFNSRQADQQVEVIIAGKLFTSFMWSDSVYKPILYPVYTSEGTEITRGFPLKPREGESSDHRHQVGIWLNYGNVNGFDFWGNGSEGKKSPNGGVIKHLNIEKITEGSGEGSLLSNESWVDPDGKELLSEKTEYHFLAEGTVRIIDRITTLTATAGTVSFKDTKEGMFGIRVARQLQLPTKEDIVLKEASGGTTTVKPSPGADITGNYRSSEGITGVGVWGTRARWMNLFGSIGNEKVSLIVCDHPENISYPTYWHAREYGLFSANPLGAKDFTEGKEEVNFSIPDGKSVTFRYRVIVNSGEDLPDSEINKYADAFAEKY